jgi:hypothetical protein
MRRFLGLAFLLGAFACAGSAERAPHDRESTASAASSFGSPAANGLRGSARRAPPTSKPRGQASLSGACTTDLTLHGNPGAVVSQPSIAMLFWGSYWSGSGTTERQQYDAAWAIISADPAFYARLAEYSTSAQTIGAGSWAGSASLDPSLGGDTVVTEAQIQQELAAEVAAGPAAGLTPHRIYVVMLPPGATSQFDQENDFAGHHSQFTPPGGAVPIRYAVITYNSDQGYSDPVISHEISEAITDPDLSTGWYDESGEEIGDLCRFDYAMLDGYPIEEIFSIRSCSCVGAGTGTDGGVADAGGDSAIPSPSCDAPSWSASAVYSGGTTASYGGSEYTAAYWNQGEEPDTHSGPAGSGQPWLAPASCTTTTCAATCGDKQCGSDGCDGTCGTCPSSQACNASGQCVPSCVPSCNLKQCGTDGCGGSCGTCPSGLTCNPNNQCVAPCVPACNGKACGGDSCGGSCGTCGVGEACTSDGTCHPSTSACSELTPWDPNQPWYAYTVGDQHTGSNSRRYTCKNVAYCIDDPTGAVGGTYGWTDDGPC